MGDEVNIFFKRPKSPARSSPPRQLEDNNDQSFLFREFRFKNWGKSSTEIIFHTVCRTKKKDKLSVGSAVLFGQ